MWIGRRYCTRPQTTRIVPNLTVTKTKVQVRIDGETEPLVRRVAQEMGVTITKVYPKRNGKGVLGYGYKETFAGLN